MLLLWAGYQDKELTLDCTETTLRVQPQGSPPVIHRLLGERIDASSALETYKCVRLHMHAQQMTLPACQELLHS